MSQEPAALSLKVPFSSSDVRVLVEVLSQQSGPVGHHTGSAQLEGSLKVLLLVQHPQVSRNAPLTKMPYQKSSHNEPIEYLQNDP